MATQVGSAFISVAPDLRNFHKKIAAELDGLEGQVSKSGLSAGKAFQDAFKQGLGNPLEPITNPPLNKPTTGGDKAGGAFGRAFRKRVQAAIANLPDAKLGADASEADRKIDEIRQRLKLISDTDVTIHANATAAQAQLDRIRAELAQLGGRDATVDVQANVAAAMAELQAFESEVNRVDGRTASVNVRADTGAAMAALQALGVEAAIVASIPVGASLGAGLAGLASAAGAAGAGVAGMVAASVPGITRIHEALQAQKTAQDQVTTSTGRAATVTQSAAVVEDQRRMRVLQLASAQAQVAQAERQAAQAHAQAVQQVRQAESSLTDAQRTARQAQLDLNAARRQAKLDAQDLANSVVDAALSERSAELSIVEARQALLEETQRTAAAEQAVADARKNVVAAQAASAKVAADVNATAGQKKAAEQAVANAKQQVTAAEQAAKDQQLAQKRAQLSVEQAVQALKEQRLQLKRLQAQKSASDKAGIAGDTNVIAARRRLADANRQVAAQERAVAQARLNVARVDQQSADQIASAQRALAQQRLSAKLAADQQAQAARNAAGAAGGTSAAALKAANALAKLSPAERQLARDWQDFSTTYQQWARALEPAVFPVISDGLKLISSQLPRLNGLIVGSAGAMQGLEKDAEAALNGPFYSAFLHNMTVAAPIAITNLGHTAGNVFTGLAGIVNAFLPYTQQITGFVERASADFATWGKNLNGSDGFAHFMAYVQEAGPSVVAAISGLWHGVQQLVIALAPAGPSLLEIVGGFGHLVGYIAQVDPGLVQIIALIYALNKANKILGITSMVAGFRGLATSSTVASAGMYRLGAGARVATTSLVGTEAAAVGTKGAFAGLGLGATLLVADFFALQAANEGMHRSFTAAVPGASEYAKALTQLNTTGKMTGRTWQDVQIAFEALAKTPGVAAHTPEIQKVFQSLDTVLTNMVKSGNTKTAAADFNALWRAAQKNGVTWPEFTKQFPHYANVVNTATVKTRSFMSALTSLYNRSKGDLLTANLQVAQSIKAVGDSFAANGSKIHGNSLAALENKDAVRQAAQSISAYVTSVYNSTRASQGETAARKKSLEVLRNRRRALINEMVQAGLTRTAATKLANQYIKTPKAVQTKYSTPGYKGAYNNAKTLRHAIVTLPNLKQIHVTADTSQARKAITSFKIWFNKQQFKKTASIYGYTRGPGVEQRPLGSKATGGIMRFAGGSERHIAQIARPGEMRLWAEPETQGEAYIPLAPSKRGRSLAILQQVAAEFGYALAPLLQGAVRFAAGGIKKKRPITTSAPATTQPKTATTKLALNAGNDPATAMANVADAATAADTATRTLADTLPKYGKAAKASQPVSATAAAGLQSIATRATTATTRMRTLALTQTNQTGKATTGLTKHVTALSATVARNSATTLTNTNRQRTARAAVAATSGAILTSTNRTRANSASLATSNARLATNASRVRTVGREAVVSRGHVDKFVNAYIRKPYKIAREITVNAKGKFTMTGFSGGWATGGPVFGPGTATSDSIPARLSAGEHVWTAKEVQGAGGHGNVMALRQAAAQGQVPGFAKGGPVTRSIANESVPEFTPDYNAMMRKIINAAMKSTAVESAKYMKSLLGGAAMRALLLAESREGIKYVYGGTSWSSGMDCSGLTMLAYKKAGINIPRTSQSQWGAVKHIPVRKALPGDLLFAEFGGGGPGHVGFRTQYPYNSAKASFNEPHTGAVARYRTMGGWTGAGQVPGAHVGGYGGVPGSTKGGIHAGPGKSRAWAQAELPELGWRSQFGSLNSLWNHESNWRWNADNPYSTAYGIPQALPGSKMRSAGRDWHDNSYTQMKWGLKYIHDRYGSPNKAWRSWQARSPHWYDAGGWLKPGINQVVNATGKPEAVLTPAQSQALIAMAKGGDGASQIHEHYHLDGLTVGTIESKVRSAVQARDVAKGRQLQVGRRR